MIALLQRLLQHKVARLRFLRFIATGALSVSVGFSTTVLLREGFGLTPQIAGAGGLLASLLLNFLTVRSFVFARTGPAGGEFLRYVLTSLGFRGVEYCAYLLLLDQLGLPYPVAYMAVVSCSVVLKFLVYRSFVFRSPARANEAAIADA
jgi:putative flippase GtrA